MVWVICSSTWSIFSHYHILDSLRLFVFQLLLISRDTIILTSILVLLEDRDYEQVIQLAQLLYAILIVLEIQDAVGY